MATTGSTYFARPNYRFLSNDLTAVISADSALELDESDIYFSVSSRSGSPDFRRPACPMRKSSSKCGDLIERPRHPPPSLPVNIPDWSKILRDEYMDSRSRRGGSLENDFYDYEGDGDTVNGGSGNRLPPHEFLARTRIGSFSVQEGAGRTLKGTDLSRVRNAVWARIGFQD